MTGRFFIGLVFVIWIQIYAILFIPTSIVRDFRQDFYILNIFVFQAQLSGSLPKKPLPPANKHFPLETNWLLSSPTNELIDYLRAVFSILNFLDDGEKVS
jgi:hypothetical protein